MEPGSILPDLPSVDTAMPTDAELMRRLTREDRVALALLYERHGGLIFSLALHMTADRHLSEEVLQDTFVRLWKHAASFDANRASVRTWMLRIARNLCLDRLRALKRRPILGRLAEDIPEPVGSRALLAGDEREQIRRAVGALEPEMRRCLELAYFEGLSQSEIAERLDHPLGTVKGRIRRALMRLRETLPSYGF